MTVEWLSLREFARRRGVTLAAVQKAVASGRVQAVRRNERGHLVAIELHEATRQWHERTDAELALRTGTIVAPPPPESPPATAVQPAAEAGAMPPAAPLAPLEMPAAPRAPAEARDEPDESDAFHRDRARNEQLKRINGEIDLALRLKTLVRADDARRAGFEAARQVQEQLLRLPDRLAPLLAAETDPARVHALMSHEIRGALDALAERAAGLAGA